MCICWSFFIWYRQVYNDRRTWYELFVLKQISNCLLTKQTQNILLRLNCGGNTWLMILWSAGHAETGKQQKSWGCLDGHCHINWFTWHNYGVSHEEDLSLFGIQSFTICSILVFPVVPGYSRNEDEGQNRLNPVGVGVFLGVDNNMDIETLVESVGQWFLSRADYCELTHAFGNMHSF